MAIVADKSGNNPTVYSFKTHNRSGAGTPNGTVTPLFAGDVYFDTTNKVRWKAVALTSADWVPMESEVT